MKKTILLIIAISFMMLSALQVHAADENLPVDIKAKAAVLMDASTGKVLMKYNENERLYPASVTKIMPLLLVCEAIDEGRISLGDTVTVSASAASKGGSQIWLKEGEQMTVDELLKATAVYSANDACTALGEYIAGSDDAFVKLLNERAEQLGMTSTHFENCTGLDDTTENHLTSALDVAIMSRELLKHPDIHKYTTIWMDSLRNGAFTLSNTNKLVKFYEGCTGLKTGSTDKALFCMSATAKRDGLHLIAVVMASPTSKQRQADASSLLNYGFANYAAKTIVSKDNIEKEIKIDKGIKKSCYLVCRDDINSLCKKGEEKNIRKEYLVSKSYTAPVKKGEKAGELVCYDGSKEIGRSDLIYGEDVEKMTLSYSYGSIIDLWLCKK